MSRIEIVLVPGAYSWCCQAPVWELARRGYRYDGHQFCGKCFRTWVPDRVPESG